MAWECIQFCWIPSHVGISDNELADAVTRLTLNTLHPTPVSLGTGFLPRSQFLYAAHEVASVNHAKKQQIKRAETHSKVKTVKPS